ncbi:alkaline phosphatase D family protein [Streptomyces xantholiticus]|uniref:alkaline phosphatase D family protein n=1 Tax=Streptomyces xantholiticus TaxID=68285 RepID=UPI00167B4776|nr:alkaline phosphatase D family protein [Streptomyces xantholiticus]GGW73210.1 alkaline phosphatase [Streptomyces xantholiticus]
MTGLRLGPLLRHVDWESGTAATVWVETDRACTAEVRCDQGGSGSARTFVIAGHHYALVPVTGLTPGSSTAYEVLLDGERVWPPEDSTLPPSTIHTPSAGSDAVRVTFGSCRWAARPAHGHDPVGPDALYTLAARLASAPDRDRPDVLLLLGDQVYADETSEATGDRLAARRDPGVPPGSGVADYEEYTWLYDESWRDPDVRWLLSTVPTCMIFDDHDVIDDWNTSTAWLADMRATPWWHERIVSALMSYWVYQHLGNLSPAELAADPLYEAVRSVPDGTATLRAFAEKADSDPSSVRWSYRRDFGRTRLLMVDTRAARVLEEQSRSILDPGEAQWLREQATDGPGSFDHLLIGTSLPWLLPPLIHHAESWNAALCRGERGERWSRFGEKLRRHADLEHWSAFPSSFEELTRLITKAGSGPDAPATVCVLSGDVHHAYVAEPDRSRGREGAEAVARPEARVLQLTCSPVHNSIPRPIRIGFRFGWSSAGRRLGRAFARHGRTGMPPVRWHRTGGPWFGNQLMTLTLCGRSASLRLEQARAERGGGRGRLTAVFERRLTEDGGPGGG